MRGPFSPLPPPLESGEPRTLGDRSAGVRWDKEIVVRIKHHGRDFFLDCQEVSLGFEGAMGAGGPGLVPEAEESLFRKLKTESIADVTQIVESS